MKEAIVIKTVTTKDLIELQKISRETFIEAFSTGNSEENMASYVEESLSTERLTAELNNTESAFYFARLDQKVIGYLKLNVGSAQTEMKDQRALEIERIYVLQEYLGQKVGQVLYEKAIDIAIEKSADYVWLGVWEENARAIGFYKKNGFVEFDKHIFKLGDDEQTDIMMKKALK